MTGFGVTGGFFRAESSERLYQLDVVSEVDGKLSWSEATRLARAFGTRLARACLAASISAGPINPRIRPRPVSLRKRTDMGRSPCCFGVAWRASTTRPADSLVGVRGAAASSSRCSLRRFGSLMRTERMPEPFNCSRRPDRRDEVKHEHPGVCAPCGPGACAAAASSPSHSAILRTARRSERAFWGSFVAGSHRFFIASFASLN